MPSILFVCAANQFRSPLAAGIFAKAMAEEQKVRVASWDVGAAADWQVASAGLHATSGLPVLPDVLNIARELGIDLSSHRSQLLDERVLSDFDLIIVMERAQQTLLQNRYPELREHIYLLSYVVEYKTYDIPDADRSPQSIRGMGAILNDLIRRSLSYICVLAIALHNKKARA